MDLGNLLRELSRPQILAAIRAADASQGRNFGESIKFDMLFQGKRYPPKRVVGLALESVLGTKLAPNLFKGGSETACFRALQRCGFTIVLKPDQIASGPLAETFAEILELQKRYSKVNSPDMQRRGVLIRQTLPSKLGRFVPSLEPLFSAHGYSCELEGSDGAGNKNESPWVRIYDPEMSPSATTGWYLVFHFSRHGDIFYATLGCGATVFRQGSLIDVPHRELANRLQWASQIANEVGFPTSEFSDPPLLHGNKLSRQYERAILAAKSYRTSELQEEQLGADLMQLSALLVAIYDAERSGLDPAAETAEELAQQQLEKVLRPTSAGQGRGLTKPEQIAVELRAMEVTRAALEANGFDQIRDVSKNSPFDFAAFRDEAEWIAEAKGTTSKSPDVVLLTANEVKAHAEYSGRSVLAIVCGIKLHRSTTPPRASGGELHLFCPWKSDDWDFEPTAYRARRKTT